MDIDSKIQEKNSVLNMLWNQLKWFPMKLIHKINNIANNTINIGKNDPRKIWHASKVGLSLTLVILFYYSWPLYHSFEQSAIMAVLTVMVAFEYTAGATISKCLNIAFATALGVSLGIGAKYLAEICGKEGEPIILGFLVFILGMICMHNTIFFSIIKKMEIVTQTLWCTSENVLLLIRSFGFER